MYCMYTLFPVARSLLLCSIHMRALIRSLQIIIQSICIHKLRIRFWWCMCMCVCVCENMNIGGHSGKQFCLGWNNYKCTIICKLCGCDRTVFALTHNAIFLADCFVYVCGLHPTICGEQTRTFYHIFCSIY